MPTQRKVKRVPDSRSLIWIDIQGCGRKSALGHNILETLY